MRNENVKGFQTIIDSLRNEIPQKMKEGNIPGLAIALVSKNGVIWCECFGYTDMSHKRAVDTDTLFSLQSTTKTVTTVAFLLAVQKGLVALDDCLVEYYPEFTVNSRVGKDQYKKITFCHLLSHTSGLTMEGKVGGVFNYVPCTWEEYIQGISGSWLKFPVGKGFSYSNPGFDLVAYALERITGVSYPAYIQKVLGDPLGITFHYDTKEVYNEKNAAKGYLGEFRAVPVDPGLGSGAAYLSITDQAVFVKFLLNLGTVDGKEILKAEYIDAMRSTDKEGWYGLGTFVNKEYGITIPHHPGGGFGLASAMYWVPEYDIGVAVFTNQEEPIDNNYITVLAKKALERVLEIKGVLLEPTDFPFVDTPVKDVDPELLERLTGVYSGVFGGATINLSDGKLYLDSGKKIALTPHTETAFSAESPRGLLFQLDKGKPVSLKMYTTDRGILHMDYHGNPPESPGPNKPEWKQFTGLYWMTFYGTEPSYCAVKTESDGYLHFKWGRSTRLYQHETIPTLFFTFHGDALVFEKDYLRFSNIKFEKIDDPVTEVLKKCSERPELLEWVVNDVVNNLKYLRRDEEAEKVVQLKQK